MYPAPTRHPPSGVRVLNYNQHIIIESQTGFNNFALPKIYYLVYVFNFQLVIKIAVYDHANSD